MAKEMEFARKALALDPISPKGNKAEARAEFQKATSLDDLPWYISSLGYACAVSGDRAKAEQIVRDLEELAKQRYVSPANRASVYLGLGENEKAWIGWRKPMKTGIPSFGGSMAISFTTAFATSRVFRR